MTGTQNPTGNGSKTKGSVMTSNQIKTPGNQICMKVMLIITLLVGVMFAVVEAQQQSEGINTLKIATMDLPPYGWVDEQGKKHGIVFELGQEIGIRSGTTFTNDILPFNRMLMLLKQGKIDILSSQPHQRALEAGDKLAVIFNINVIAATKKGSGISSIGDFKGKSLIYHQAASYKQLEGLPGKIYRVNSYKQSLETLYLRKGVDGAVFSEPAYYYFMHELGLTPKDFGEVVYIERDKKQWMFVRRGLPLEIRENLKRVVEEIYQENLYEALLKKYGKD